MEISFSKINDYKATYSKYLYLRQDRQEKQLQAKKNQDKYMIKTALNIYKKQETSLMILLINFLEKENQGLFLILVTQVKLWLEKKL